MARNMYEAERLNRVRRNITFSANVVPDITDPVDLVTPEDYVHTDLIKLFIRMRDTEIRNRKGEWILEKCQALFRKDYECEIVDNHDSHTPGEHPRMLIIPVIEKDTPEKVMHFDPDFYVTEAAEGAVIEELCLPLPVILFNGKYICRSRYPSIMRKKDPEQPERTHPATIRFAEKNGNFLRSMGISYIFELTSLKECDIEDNMSSNELSNFYRNISVHNLPYPRRELYSAYPTPDLEVYEEITMNRIKILLENLVEENGGILLQSLRGGYRVTFFVSLLRLTMWADGVIHKSLNFHEILFLTMGYDWYSFGYRITACELRRLELTFFFGFLTSICSSEFSITGMFEDFASVKPKESTFPRYNPARRRFSLMHLNSLLLVGLDQAMKYVDRFQALCR